ncbi:MAG: AAA family ATPase [Syntrophales bacterium]|jgi:predicted ATPase|nr:AAA family ATPase [Syntrophales bacterium]
MRLDYLKIDRFKNLTGFAVDFDETCQEPVTVVLGRNGSGKSNLFEALVIIFRDLIKGKATADFGYDLRYTLRGGAVVVRIWNPPTQDDDSDISTPQPPFTAKGGEPINTFSFTVTEKDKENRIPKKDITKFLPRYVVTYYSGVSNRMEHHFFQPQLEFRDELLKGNIIPLRPLFYAKPIHSHFALLAFFMTEDPEVTEFLSEYPWIEGLESALFVLKRPHWAKGQKQRKDGDPRFWYAGGVVKDFLSCVYDSALAPMRQPGRIQHSFDQVENTEFLYLYLRDEEKLRKLARESVAVMQQKGQQKTGFENEAFKAAEFFKLLESTFMSDLIYETRIRVKVRHAGALTFRELSEGEQQLLTVVGMLRFTRDEDSLFLLDEPDTHLNPAWGMEYLNILRKHADTGRNSHLLVATHDPLVLTNLRRNQVVILERDSDSGTVASFEPEEDPVGMGVQGILRNMFGLRSAVGTEIQNKLDRHAELLVLDKQRTSKQEEEFTQIAGELENAGFGREFRDPDYASFIRAMTRRPEFRKPVLTVEELKRQETIADEILEEILSKQGKRK